MEIISVVAKKRRPVAALTDQAKWDLIQEKVLPSHHHKNKIFTIDEEFYPLSLDDEALATMAKKLLAWVGIKHNGLKIVFSHLEADGDYTESGHEKLIVINSRYQANSFQAAAVLAHLISHYMIVGRARLVLSGHGENEVLTDLTSIALGFGPVVLNGHYFSRHWLASLRAKPLSIGTLSPEQYAENLWQWSNQQNIPSNNISSQLMPWVRRLNPGKQHKPRSLVIYQQLREWRQANLKIGGAIASSVAICFFTGYIWQFRPSKVPANLVEQRDKIAVLQQSLVACRQAVEQKKTTYSTKDIMVERALTGHQNRCQSLQNRYNYEVDQLNRASKDQK